MRKNKNSVVISRRISQAVSVLQNVTNRVNLLFSNGLTSVDRKTIEKCIRKAFDEVASNYGVISSTVRDKCCRQLRLNTVALSIW